MRERDFEDRHIALWHDFEQQVSVAHLKKTKPDARFPQRYRQLCHHLAIARQRDYSETLVHRLNRLVMAGHHVLYRREQRINFNIIARAQAQFVLTLRHARIYLICAAVLFVLPVLLMGGATYFDHSLTYSLLSPSEVSDIESMYDPENRRLGPERDAETDLVMFGYYIKHNISIAFKAFAGGIFLGIGSVFVLLFNGLFLGAVAGHLTQAGFSETFYPFVVGHGAFELTAIVISGAAGMMMGFALINPGRLRRVEALRTAAAQAVKLMYGAILMLFLAAFIEAFWSSSTQLPVVLKLAVGACFWLLVLWFCFFSSIGKSRESH